MFKILSSQVNWYPERALTITLPPRRLGIVLLNRMGKAQSEAVRFFRSELTRLVMGYEFAVHEIAF